MCHFPQSTCGQKTTVLVRFLFPTKWILRTQTQFVRLGWQVPLSTEPPHHPIWSMRQFLLQWVRLVYNSWSSCLGLQVYYRYLPPCLASVHVCVRGAHSCVRGCLHICVHVLSKHFTIKHHPYPKEWYFCVLSSVFQHILYILLTLWWFIQCILIIIYLNSFQIDHHNFVSFFFLNNPSPICIICVGHPPEHSQCNKRQTIKYNLTLPSPEAVKCQHHFS